MSEIRFTEISLVMYINMGQASRTQANNDWDLEKMIRQVKQNFATGRRTIAGEPTNDEKLIITLVCLGKKTTDQIPDEYRERKKHSSTMFG